MVPQSYWWCGMRKRHCADECYAGRPSVCAECVSYRATNVIPFMSEQSPETCDRRVILLFVGLAAVWRPALSSPRHLEKLQTLAGEEFVIIDGWVLPRTLLSPSHAD